MEKQAATEATSPMASNFSIEKLRSPRTTYGLLAELMRFSMKIHSKILFCTKLEIKAK